jgi:2,3-bisphosphoglycerate-independent phosphoglycerate mutase
MGAGLAMAPGDIAFKSNFATYNKDTGGTPVNTAAQTEDVIGPAISYTHP